jgi:hypothetical protein
VCFNSLESLNSILIRLIVRQPQHVPPIVDILARVLFPVDCVFLMKPLFLATLPMAYTIPNFHSVCTMLKMKENAMLRLWYVFAIFPYQNCYSFFSFFLLLKICPTDLVYCGICQNLDESCLGSQLLQCQITAVPCDNEGDCTHSGMCYFLLLLYLEKKL